MGDHDPAPGPSTLPPAWTAHISPKDGRTYYHNSNTGKSTYTLPKPKREKPISKLPIPASSGWFKITTNKDNVFYWHPKTKASKWVPPADVARAVRELEEREVEERERLKREAEEREREERERVRNERRERKRKLEQGVAITEFDASKRPRGEEDEEDDDLQSIASSEEAEVEDMHPQAAPEALSSVLNPDRDAPAENPANDEDEDEDNDEEWQRQIAEQMAAEAEAEAETEAQAENQAQVEDTPQLQPPASLEEAKSAFFSHLTSLNGTKNEINPMAPWDLELPKFASHPSFLALPSKSEAEDCFNEWCKLRIREKRAAKAASSTFSAPSSSNGSSARTSKGDSRSAEEAYLSLLQKEVRSTRTKYSDFATTFSNHPAYTSISRPSERESLFRHHLVALGEEKRKAAQKAEADFLDLLSDKLPGNFRGKVAIAKTSAGGKEKEREAVMQVWTEAKRTKGVVEDERYDAVGSSTRRFELFCVWARGERRPQTSSTAPRSGAGSGSHPSTTALRDLKPNSDDEKSRKAFEKQEARKRALKEREEKVRAEKAQILRLNRTALTLATREESLLSFRQLLLDAISSPHIPFHSALPQLAQDPRFHAPSLNDTDKERLFFEHQTQLAEKEEGKLAKLFEKHSKGRLDVHVDDVLVLTCQDEELRRLPLKVYAEDRGLLEKAYERWDERRRERAEKEFKEMLGESAFVDFWGRLKKETSSSITPGSEDGGKDDTQTTTQTQRRRAGDEEEEEEEEGEEKTTLIEMAKKVDLKEIESVLRNDARFRAWKHEPGKRERWIRDHLERLAAPRKSVHR